MATRPLITSLIVAAIMLGVALLLKTAQHNGMIDRDTVERATQVLIGLMVAFYGNFIPKRIRRSSSIEGDRRMQSALRLSGWSLTLAGLAYAALAFAAPRQIADNGGLLVMASAVAITLVSCLRCVWSTRRATE